MDSIINISTNKLNIEFLEIHYQRNWMKKKNIYIYIYNFGAIQANQF